MIYQNKFKRYLNDLAAKKPAPGGGSAVSLVFCLGAALIEKALKYSVTSNKTFSPEIKRLSKLRERILTYSDLDGQLFSEIFKSKDAKKIEAVKNSEKIVVDIGKSCLVVLDLVKKVEFFVKKGIISDFIIGRETIVVVLEGCILNLEANSKMFGSNSAYTDKFKTVLSNERILRSG